ncbi:TnsD family Tn7-like transposition protein [Cellvibrio sp.]|uniref:TnsD family Tn7-like transposition protein n=1 Tax=Cellvibrio sp. TaxID=1965322 RepID=UPI0039647752
MLNFPIPYQEELLYSTIARAGIRHGLTSPKQLLDEVFNSRTVIATLDLPNHISSILNWLPSEFNAEKLIYNHTLFPIYAPFIPEERRQKCMKWMLKKSQGAIHVALGVAASRIKTLRFIRYCPKCVTQQKLNYGEYFWCREWQIAGIETCSIHKTLALINTKISRTGVERHRFIAASPDSCPVILQSQKEIMSGWVGQQVQQLLMMPAEPSASFSQWTKYYQELARQFGFVRGNAQIEHQKIKEQILQVWPKNWLIKYGLTFNAHDNQSDWLCNLFRKHRKTFSYLEHIVVNQTLLGEDWKISDVIAAVRKYPEDRKSDQINVKNLTSLALSDDQHSWINLLRLHTPKKSRKISPALYARLYRNYRDWLLDINCQHAKDRSIGHKLKVDWEYRDREYLQALAELDNFFKANNKCARRSRAMYLKTLGNVSTIEKNMDKMPLTYQFLSEKVETVSQYQVRRLQNAYEDLRGLFEFPPRWRLLRNSGLSEERLTEYSRSYLEDLVSYEHEVQRRRK